jgi:PAS domain S-box-containing protein
MRLGRYCYVAKIPSPQERVTPATFDGRAAITWRAREEAAKQFCLARQMIASAERLAQSYSSRSGGLLVADKDRMAAKVSQVCRLPADMHAGRLRDGSGSAFRYFHSSRTGQRLQNVVVPEILARMKPGDTVRAWVIDCDTGEEAYAIAVMLAEATAQLGNLIGVEVFATDTDRGAVAVARAGTYDETIAQDIPLHRLQRWFARNGEWYSVSRELRDTCIFAVHDVLKDIPFSRMDLICCRRSMDHMDVQLQEQLVQLFGIALRPGGCLITSADAGVRQQSALFKSRDEQSGIFSRLENSTPLLPSIPLVRPATRQATYVNHIESKLRSTKEELRQAIRELEQSNRGLRNTNDQLEFSKDALNSTSTELQTVNGELSYRIKELARSNGDLRILLDSSQIATIFLDRKSRMTKFTAEAAKVLGLTMLDIGRSVDQIACGLAYEGLQQDIDSVLQNVGIVERQLQDASNGNHFLLRIVSHRDADKAIAGAVLNFLDITAAMRAEDALRQSEERFQMMAATVPAALFTANVDLAWDYVNPPFYEFTGLRSGSALGEGWLAAVHEADLGEVRDRLAKSRVTGGSFELEFRLRDASSGYRWYLARATAVRNSAGEVLKWAGSLIDIHQRRMAEARQRLLFAELQHRVKNILGIVRSIASQTLETSSSLDDFATHFDGRLNALARTQASLARHGDAGLDLEELIAEELLCHAPADEKQFKISGPAIRVDERTAEALGLAIHELATNAVKYGAFANPSGSISVSWKLRRAGDQQRLHLEWLENTVSVVDPRPRRCGFGREFLERGLAFELEAETTLEFRPGGLRFVLDAALGANEVSSRE